MSFTRRAERLTGWCTRQNRDVLKFFFAEDFFTDCRDILGSQRLFNDEWFSRLKAVFIQQNSLDSGRVALDYGCKFKPRLFKAEIKSQRSRKERNDNWFCSSHVPHFLLILAKIAMSFCDRNDEI